MLFGAVFYASGIKKLADKRNSVSFAAPKVL
jgi:hypothetical protein